MRSLLSADTGDDVAAAFVAVPANLAPGRPWVRVNMVASIDGASRVDGESRGLSGPADRALFHRLRGEADAVLAGSTTVRADRYGPAKADEATRGRRAARGQSAVPGVVVVTRSGDLPWDTPLFTSAAPATVVAHPTDATPPPQARRAGATRLLALGQGSVDIAALLDRLGEDGVRHVLCEGGPTVVGQLLAADRVDELFLAVAPRLVAGDAPRIARGPVLDPPREMTLGGVLEADGFLFLRYVRAPA